MHIVVLKAIIQRSLVSSTVVMTYLIPIMYIPISVANTLFNVSPIIMFFVEVYLFKKVNIIFIFREGCICASCCLQCFAL